MFLRERLFTLLSVALLLLTPVAYASADALTATSTTGGTDDLIGATNTSWTFTATTTGQIDKGAVVKFSVPIVSQAVPFSLGTPAVTASSSIVLVTSTSTHALGVSAAQGPGGAVIWGFASSTVPAGTTFSVTINGINNATGQLSSMRNLTWNLQAGTSSNPMQAGNAPLTQTAFNATSSATNLNRAGGALISDVNSKISLSTTALAATNVTYTFSIKTTTQIPIGGKIYINFPATYDINSATSTAATQNISNNTAAQIAVGAVATSTDGGGNKRVIFTVSNAVVNAGDIMTVKVAGLTNPATADVYRPFALFTTKANNGLIDGSYFGFEPSDYGGGAPPPNDTIYIGGLNTLNVQVLKSNGSGGTTALSAGDIAQMKVAAGCPDRQYFMGMQWLNASGIAIYQGILDCNYMVGVDPFSATSTSFYGNFLPPGMKQVNLVSSGGTGQIATTTLVFGIPDSTTTVALTGGVAGANAFINAYSADNQSFSPVYTTPTGTTPGFDGSGNGYAHINIDSGKTWNFNVVGGQFGSGGNFSDGSGNKYWAPQIPSINLTAASTSANLGTFAYVLANETLDVTLQDTNLSPISNACVGVSRSGGGIFMGPQDMICAPNHSGQYEFKVPFGSVTIDVSLPGHGQPAEYPIAISGVSNSKTITLSAPTSYISVLVQTSGGTKVKGAPVFANGSNGFGNAMTDTNGAAKLYVQPGTYAVQGFAPGFGQFTSQNATVTGGSNPSVTFTVNTGALKTISGTVTQGGTGVAGMNIGAFGTGSTQGGNGTQTDANGNYTLYVPAGAYQIGGWSSSAGGLTPQSVDVSSGNASSINWSLGAQGTLHLTVQHASGLSQLYAGVFTSNGPVNGTNSWTASSTDEVADLTLPAGTGYSVQAGSPGIGQFGSQSGVTITGGGTTNVTFDATASITLSALSGSVKSSGTGVANANVWASRTDGPGFFSTQTDASGNYSLSVPDGKTYTVGVRSLSYIPDQGDIQVPVSGNTTKNFTVTSAGSIISGKVQDSNGNGIAQAWVSAVQTGVASSTSVGAQADDAGNYSLNVSSASTWNITAEGSCYPRSAAIAASAGDSGKNITLSAQNGCTKPTPTVYAIVDTTGGQISTGNMTINIPANVLGTSQQTDTVSLYDTPVSAVAAGSSATPLTGSVREIKVTDPSGQPITKLNGMVTITTKYDPAAIPAGMTASDLQFGYFNTNTGQWEPIAASVDTVNHTFTVQVNHFTEDGPILPGVPAAPTGLTATAASASGINLSWTASPSATSYTIYRSTTNSNFTSSVATGVAGTSYSDTGLSASTAYYYEVAGVDGSGEGQNSSSANATTNAAASSGGGGGNGPIMGTTVATASTAVQPAGIPNSINVQSTTMPAVSQSAGGQEGATSARFAGLLKLGSRGANVSRLQQLLGIEPSGYYGVQTRAAVEAFQLKYGIVKKGGAGFGQLGPKTRTKILEIFSSLSPQANGSSQMAAEGSQILPQTIAPFTRSLRRGSVGTAVRMLQVVLNSDPDTQIATSGEGSQGNETVYFGIATLRAVEKFQLKYHIASAGDSAFGYVGPATRAKLQELLSARMNAGSNGTASVVTTPAPAPTSTSATSLGSAMIVGSSTTTTGTATASSTAAVNTLAASSTATSSTAQSTATSTVH